MTTKQLNSFLNKKKNIHFSKKRLIQSSLTILIASSLTACGGGSTSTTLPVKPTIAIDPTDYNYVAAPYDFSGLTITYTDTDTAKIVPVSRSAFASSTSGDYYQQTLTNADDVWSLGSKGQGITVAVVDVGINQNHTDFYNELGITRIDYNHGLGISAPENDVYSNGQITDTVDGYVDGSLLNTDNDYTTTTELHGTHVSSIAIGREYGIAPEATLLPINVVPNSVGNVYNTAIHYGVDYAATFAPIVNVSFSGMVNFSITGDQYSEFNAYLTTLKNNDTVLVAAAGNGGIDGIGDPIGAEHFINHDEVRNLALQTSIENQVLSVIAIDSTGSRASFSNYPGSCSNVGNGADLACNDSVMSDIQNTFIAAPGVLITAADASTNTGSIQYSGTSMAAPVVSGALSLLMSAWNQLTPQQAVKLLKENANKSFTGYSAAEYGVGILDIRAAFEPSGTLKSTTSATTNSATTSYALGESSVKVPASLSGLTSLSALKSVAYFDNYNRDFLVDITPAIQIEKTPIGWNRYWANTQPGLTTQAEVAKFTVSAGFDYNNENNLKNLKISDDQLAIQYARNSSNGFVESQFTPLSQNFYSNNLNDFGNSLAIMQNITPGLFVYSAVQEQQAPTLKGVQNNQPFAKLQSVGVNYHLTPTFAINVSSQLREEQDALMGIQGTGTFSFGDKNLSQMNTFALQYNNNGTQLFGQYQTGQLLNSQLASGSYLDVKNVELGQFKFGVLQQVNNHSSWGVQAYNYNTLLNSDINLTLPTGMNANGDIETQTVKYHQQGNINPDTVELFFNFKTAKQSHLQLNAINNPDDSGIGISMSKRF